MTEISEDNSYTNSGYSPTVGERLRLAREAKKVTISEVVAQLRLTKENIVYLESDQWDKLHARPYARGYFSSYVNFLGLPHEEMLALFNLEYTSHEPSMDGFKRSENSNQSGGSAWFKSLLLIIVFITACWFGYQYWLKMQTQVQATEAATDSILPSLDNEQATNDSFSAGSIEAIPALESEKIVENSVVEEQGIEQETDKIEELNANELLNNPAPEVLDKVDAFQPEQQSENSAINEDIEVNNTVPAIVAEPKMLFMHFSEDCWVEIKDRNNKSLVHKIEAAGETVELTGEWPLQVLLGNASAVAVRYNDAEFDITSYIRSNVARFSVGEATE